MMNKPALLLLLAIAINAVLLAFIWAHHIFVTGFNPLPGAVFWVVSMLILLPVLFFFFRRVARGSLRLTPAMTFIFGFFLLLVGNFMNTANNVTSTLDIQLHDTYFVIAHVHVVLFFALLFLAFAAVYFVFPRIAGRNMNATMGYIHFVLTLIASFFICRPYNYIGLTGMSRRYMDYSTWMSMYGFSGANDFIILVMILFVCGQVVFVANLVWASMKGPKTQL